MRSIVSAAGRGSVSMALMACVVALPAGVVGCANAPSLKIPQATGGSRADGVVEMSYEWRAGERPEVEWPQALESAKQRCLAWGYSDAAPFGGQKSTCQTVDCSQRIITIPYQCTGAIEAGR